MNCPDPTSLRHVRFLYRPRTDRRPVMVYQIKLLHTTSKIQCDIVKLETSPTSTDFSRYTHKVRMMFEVMLRSVVLNPLKSNRYATHTTVCSDNPINLRQVYWSTPLLLTFHRGPERTWANIRWKKKQVKSEIEKQHYLTLVLTLTKILNILRRIPY